MDLEKSLILMSAKTSWEISPTSWCGISLLIHAYGIRIIAVAEVCRSKIRLKRNVIEKSH